MSNKIIGIIIAVVIIGGIFFFFQNQYGSNPQSNQQVAQQGAVNKQSNTITIQNFSFSPDTLTVKQGTKVTWLNNDSVTHTIKSDTFNSSNLNQGDKFEFTFDNKGSFDYSCGIHPSMRGKVIVE